MSERAEKTRIDIGHALHSCVIAVSICNVGVLYVRKLALGLLCTLANGSCSTAIMVKNGLPRATLVV